MALALEEALGQSPEGATHYRLFGPLTGGRGKPPKVMVGGQTEFPVSHAYTGPAGLYRLEWVGEGVSGGLQVEVPAEGQAEAPEGAQLDPLQVLARLVDRQGAQLLKANEQLQGENERLRAENERLRAEGGEGGSVAWGQAVGGVAEALAPHLGPLLRDLLRGALVGPPRE